MADFNTYYDEEKKKGERMTGAIGDAFGEVARRTKEMINGPPADVSDPMTSPTPEFRNPLMTGTSAPGTMAASGADPFAPEPNPITSGGTPSIPSVAGPARGSITGQPDTLQPMGESFAPQGSPQAHTPTGAQTVIQGGTHYHGPQGVGAPTGGGNMAPAGGGGGFDPNSFIADANGEKWTNTSGGFERAPAAGTPTAGMTLSKGDVNYQTGRAERPVDYSQEEWSGLTKPSYGGSGYLEEMWSRVKGMKDKHLVKALSAISDLAKGVFLGNTGLDEGWLKAQAALRDQGIKGQYGEREQALRNLGGVATAKLGGTAHLGSSSIASNASMANQALHSRTQERLGEMSGERNEISNAVKAMIAEDKISAGNPLSAGGQAKVGPSFNAFKRERPEATEAEYRAELKRRNMTTP